MGSISMISQNFGASALGNISAGQVQANNQGRMLLANVAGFMPNQNAVAALQLTDKAFELQGLRDQTNFQVSQLMGDSSHSVLKKNNDQRQRLMNSGATFA